MKEGNAGRGGAPLRFRRIAQSCKSNCHVTVTAYGVPPCFVCNVQDRQRCQVVLCLLAFLAVVSCTMRPPPKTDVRQKHGVEVHQSAGCAQAKGSGSEHKVINAKPYSDLHKVRAYDDWTQALLQGVFLYSTLRLVVTCPYLCTSDRNTGANYY